MEVLKIECVYDGMTVAKTGITNVKFKASFSEVTSYIRLVGLISIDLLVGTKLSDEDKVVSLGKMRIKSINITKEGEAKIQLYGESVNTSNIKTLMDKIIVLHLKG